MVSAPKTSISCTCWADGVHISSGRVSAIFLLLRRSKLRSTCRHVRCSLCHLRLLCGVQMATHLLPLHRRRGTLRNGDFGNRAAMGVIMGGMLMITVIAKNWKALLAGIFISISVFVFFSYTNIGSGNQYIHKMRSSFHPSEDASYQVRVENRQRMKELMAKKPLGYGIGLSKAGNFDSREQMPYPPDSWLVSVWVETGIVGLILYLSIHGILFAWCSWILMFKVRNKGLRGLIAACLYGCRIFLRHLCQRHYAVSQPVARIHRLCTLFCSSTYRQAHQ